MQIKSTKIDDTFAEAFEMWGSRIIVTAINGKWARIGAQALSGFATSVIGCGCEAGIEGEVDRNNTPDGREGVSVLIFGQSKERLTNHLINRIGQAVMTTPTTACFNGLAEGKDVGIGSKLRFFGDGFQISKFFGGKRFWRVPVMDGEFLIEEIFRVKRSVGGGNFIILGKKATTTLKAAERAINAMKSIKNVIMPFPGGIVRSGSKIGSRYKFLSASTNTFFCPTIKAQVKSSLPESVNGVLEVVIDGLDIESVKRAMKAGIEAASMPGIELITAGNYGGKLGKYNIALYELFGE